MQPLREMVRQFSALIPLPSLVSPLLTIRCVKKNELAVRKIRYSQTCIKREPLFSVTYQSPEMIFLNYCKLSSGAVKLSSLWRVCCHLFCVSNKLFSIVFSSITTVTLTRCIILANRNTVHLCMVLSSSPLLPSFLLAQEEEESDT